MDRQDILNHYIKTYKEVFQDYPILEQTIDGKYAKTVIRHPGRVMSSYGFVILSSGLSIIEDPNLISNYLIDSSINAFKNLNFCIFPNLEK